MSSANNADYTGFNYKDFASWAKSSTGKPYKATQPQIAADKQQEQEKPDYTGFNQADFASWAKSSSGKPYKATADSQPDADKQPRFDYTTFVAMAKSETVQD